MTRVLAIILILTAATAAQVPVPALPQTYIDTSYHSPIGGLAWKAHTSTDLKNALNSANPGDTIILDAGVTYVGNFIIPAKANANGSWIYVISSALAKLPESKRVAPADSVNMPIISSPNAGAPFQLKSGSNHWRFVGLNITETSAESHLLFGPFPGEDGVAPLPDSITIDRCYIHGLPTANVHRGVAADMSNFAIVDSYVSDIQGAGTETQAVAAWFTNGPIKIVNNYLSATTENVMFGGAGGLTNPWAPADIEIRNNYFFKPLSWVGNPIAAVKNLLEFKTARRVLVDGNTFENVWVSAQMGFALMLTPRTHNGLLATVDDITISNNVLKNVSSGFDIIPHDNACLPAQGCTNPGEAKRVVFYNNLIELGDTTQAGYTTGYDFGGIIFRGMTDFVFQHNTVVPPPNLGYCKGSISFEISGTAPFNPPYSRTNNIWILDNVFCRQIKGPAGWVGQLPYVLTDYMGDPAPVDTRFFGNVFYVPNVDKVYPLPPNNYATMVPFTYVNPSGRNYQLSVPTWTDTSDGKISGVNSSALPTQALPLRNNVTMGRIVYPDQSGGNNQLSVPTPSDRKISAVNSSTLSQGNRANGSR